MRALRLRLRLSYKRGQLLNFSYNRRWEEGFAKYAFSITSKPSRLLSFSSNLVS
jgi:hypothetical protein